MAVSRIIAFGYALKMLIKVVPFLGKVGREVHWRIQAWIIW
jgi:hypothetical protein